MTTDKTEAEQRLYEEIGDLRGLIGDLAVKELILVACAALTESYQNATNSALRILAENKQ